MRLALIVTIIVFGIVSIAPEGVIRIFTNNKMVVSEGMEYLSIIRFSYLFFGLSYILLAALRTVETVKIAFFLALATLGINCSINYILIFGKLGFSPLGVKGAAIGTLIARILEFSCVLLYIKYKEKKLKLRWKDYCTIDKALLKAYLKISKPVYYCSFLEDQY